jgi:predicted nuclease of predicted toxin-antitoxin system
MRKRGLTADADFYELSTTLGPPPKVIWLRGCDYPTDVADGLIRKQAIRITEFLQNEDQGVLILTPQADSVRTSRSRTSSLD